MPGGSPLIKINGEWSRSPTFLLPLRPRLSHCFHEISRPTKELLRRFEMFTEDGRRLWTGGQKLVEIGMRIFSAPVANS
jgi:hypothetical protein